MMKVIMQRFLLSILLLMLITSAAFATAQAPDVLIYNGKTYDLFSNPLEDFYGEDESKRPKFWVAPDTMSSGNWRGYVATWEIIDDKLYLSKIDSWFCRPSIKQKAVVSAWRYVIYSVERLLTEKFLLRGFQISCVFLMENN